MTRSTLNYTFNRNARQCLLLPDIDSNTFSPYNTMYANIFLED